MWVAHDWDGMSSVQEVARGVRGTVDIGACKGIHW